MSGMIHILKDSEAVAAAGAHFVGTLLRSRARGTAGGLSLVLSGGTTPRRLYEILAGPAGDGLPWERVVLFWGDERSVQPDDLRSNYWMVAGTGLLDRPLGSVRRMMGELIAEEAASAYEKGLRAHFPEDALPRFDLVLLGLGADGHVASLFPGSPGLTDEEHWVVPTEVYEGTRRVTLTLPVLAAARDILFLVSGEAKAKAVRAILAEEIPGSVAALPARLLLERIAAKEQDGREAPAVTWLLDEAAAPLSPERRPL